MGETQDISRYLGNLPSPAGRRLVFDDLQDEIFRIGNSPSFAAAPRCNPSTWFEGGEIHCVPPILFMLPWAEAEAQKMVPAYLDRIAPTLCDLERRLVASADRPFFGGTSPGYGELGLFAVVILTRTYYSELNPKPSNMPTHGLVRDGCISWF